jgi:hypothetical protein
MNWPEYDAALRQRGSLTVWFTDAAIAALCAEPGTTRGEQAQYSALAIMTALAELQGRRCGSYDISHRRLRMLFLTPGLVSPPH